MVRWSAALKRRSERTISCPEVIVATKNGLRSAEELVGVAVGAVG